MTQNFKLEGTALSRIQQAAKALQDNRGVLILDDENRENEGDLIFPAKTINIQQMAHLIRYGSGIVCLCIGQELADKLELPYMVEKNTSVNKTAFTVTIEAAKGVTTGVSAADRVTTIHAAVKPGAVPEDLHRPGHVFPLIANPQGVLGRRGHTEASIDITRLAGLGNEAVICEITKDDGTMARAPEIVEFGKKFNYPVITIDDLDWYLREYGYNLV
ncbi:3,4-dihydroxy-2-butanone-4-phosphate synthase [Psittacicella melopsittaci]|uniref:3,4-dihydroxy-2-butanone 4-phosphate synthase n=1 Tax=Psittacicella melopsittaci TaxID=2028576 RepID=A0A3A1Y4L1_9GAMM|nr:3,4-dihydroxy-2-butanone-4-phosphate synthase [Psittacicella melopsittaci]RIY32158.1 3,4-dihydroxy-2-butanone-4-phosphate synthase [Psittacicella melopsittaci]